jgi:hypothetical protein
MVGCWLRASAQLRRPANAIKNFAFSGDAFAATAA